MEKVWKTVFEKQLLETKAGEIEIKSPERFENKIEDVYWNVGQYDRRIFKKLSSGTVLPT